MLLLKTAFSGYCQSYDNCGIDYSEESLNNLIIADSLFQDGNSKAMSYYKKAIDEDSMNIDAKFQLASIYHAKYILSQYDILLSSYTRLYSTKTENYLLQSIDLCESFKDYKAFYYLGELYYLEQEYNLAFFFLKEYINMTNNSNKGYQKALEYYEKCKQLKEWNDSESILPINPLENINTIGDEQNPHISHDGQLIFFIRQYNKAIINTLFTELKQEAFYSYVIGIDSLNNWIYGDALPLFEIDDKTIESFSLSANKKDLYFTACEKIRLEDRIIEDCDIYVVSFNGEEWEYPRPILEINKKNSWEGDPCISTDGKKLYFSSNSFDSFGGKDLFYSEHNSDDSWSKPINLGPDINTINDERSPFLHYDNKTLYFSSNGHFGLGGFDLFLTKKIDTSWQAPVNMGFPYNDVNDNISLTTDARSLTGYFASKLHTAKGGYDISSTEIINQFRSKSKMIINIRITGNENNDFKPQLTIEDIVDGSSIPLSQSNRSDFYSAIIDIDQSMFILKLESPGYIYTNRLMQANNQYTVFESINLKTIETGEQFEIEDLKFIEGSSEISNSGKIILNDFCNYLRTNRISIAIYSYYYSLTNGEHDENIAKNRLSNTIDFMVSLGISDQRIEGKTLDQFIEKDEKVLRSDLYFKIISK